MLSVLSGLGGMFGWGISDFFANLSSEKVGHIKTFFWSQVIGMVFMWVLFIAMGGVYNLTSLSVWVILIAASVFYALGYLLFYKAFEIGTVSVVSATVNLNVIIAMMLAMIFFGERLVGLQVPAIIMVILGVTIVSINWHELKQKKSKLALGVKETIIASIYFGIYWNLSKLLSEQIGWLSTTLFVKFGAILFLLILSLWQKNKIGLEKRSPKIIGLIAIVGIMEAAAVASVNFGLGLGNLVLVSPISSALSIVTIGLAVIFLKEKISKIQALGIVMTIAGIVLCAF